jgi:isoquinoline 1-oxidoreductase subunit alpha
MTAMTYNVNGRKYQFDADSGMPLLWVIRDIIGLTGTKYGCGVEICKACTVWIDGSPEKSCEKRASEGVGVKITTIEGLSATPVGVRLQQAFVDVQAPQCGYCQSGMLMAATSLVARSPKPTDAQIDSALGNICACGTYPRVKQAIRKATGQ